MIDLILTIAAAFAVFFALVTIVALVLDHRTEKKRRPKVSHVSIVRGVDELEHEDAIAHTPGPSCVCCPDVVFRHHLLVKP